MAATPKIAPKAKKPAKPAPAAKKAAKPAAPQGVCLNPYLTFNGTCEAAFKFYQKIFGGNFEGPYRFKDMPPSEDCKVDAKLRNKVMHMGLPIGAMMLMGMDACPDQPAKVGDNVTLSICAPNAAEAKRIFKALSARGKVTMPLAKTFWAELFGLTIDRFGVAWMVNFQGDACC